MADKKEFRVYASKDSACSFLKQKGVAKEDYAKFLKPAEGKKWKVQLTCEEHTTVELNTEGECSACGIEVEALIAESAKHREALGEAIEDLKGAEAEAVPKAKKVKAAKAPKEPKAKKISVTSVMEDLIRQGLSNAQVFEEAKKVFPKLDDDKKGYPGWYRSRLKKQGEKVAASKPAESKPAE